ncbi:MAG TPA: nucleotidyltransferase family protein [Mycobacteriales bacterium]|nr:nucleotidyltransferase family protein [Mycobacteriales bacterium]
MTAKWDVSASSWSQLWHARVSYLLAGAGVDHVMIKGQTWSGPLFIPDARVGDVDVLVSPAAFATAVDALLAAGLTLEHGKLNRFGSAVHSVVLRARNGPEVDLHDRYPGLDAPPHVTWAALRSHVVPAELAGVHVPALDEPAQALIAAASVARDGSSSASARRLAAAIEDIDWSAVGALANQTGGRPAVRAALESLGRPDHADLLGLPSTPARWWLVQANAPSDTRRVQELLDAKPSVRWRMLLRDVLPPRQMMRIIDPSTADRGRLYLAGAHLRRWSRIVRRLPGVARDLRTARRTQRGRSGS